MKVRLEDVANVAGVSVPTVSKTLRHRGGVSEAIQQRVMEAVRETGYQRKSNYLETKVDLQSITLASFVKYGSNDLFYGEIFKGVQDECRRIGLDLETALLPSDDKIDLAFLSDSIKASQAVLLIGIDEPDVLDVVAELGVAATIINGYDRQMRIPSVTPDYRYGGWQATRHLIEMGHRDIIHITHRHRDSMRRRFDGFRDALADFSIEFDPERHLLDTGTRLNNLGVERAMAQLLAKGRPDCTAFFCVSDVTALNVIQALMKAGYSVPGDFSVFGFDDLPVCQISNPQLSTMAIDRAELGRTGVRLLTQQASNPERCTRRIELGVSLVIRESVRDIS